MHSLAELSPTGFLFYIRSNVGNPNWLYENQAANQRV